MNCINYKPGEDKCRYLCGKIDKDPEPGCYNPLIRDLKEWNRVDRLFRECAEERGDAGGGTPDS